MESLNNIFVSLKQIEILILDIFKKTFLVCQLSFSLMLTLSLLCIFLLLINYLLLKLVIRFLPCGQSGKLHVAFFHPYCNAGGGGERVLWIAIKTLQQRYSSVECYIYTGDMEATPFDIMNNVRRRFNVTLAKQPQFIFLRSRFLVEAKYYPVFTLLLQSVGSFLVGIEALFKFKPDVYIDSMGYAFTYPMFRFIAGCKVVSYTHYPTISTDMLSRVEERIEAHNNRDFIARSIILSSLKVLYYQMFASIYGLVGRCANVVMVNSSWTQRHIVHLWGCPQKISIVYPPCDTQEFLNLAPNTNDGQIKIISIGQFRPEKNYPLQLRSFKKLITLLGNSIAGDVSLVLIGGVRNKEDERRVLQLKALARELGIQDRVTWKINAPFSELLEEVQSGMIGLHSMWNEHFGIGIVECMAGGLLMVANDSGGPQLDIIVPYNGSKVGFLAKDEISYAQTMKHIIMLSAADKKSIREAARNSVYRFSNSVFEEQFIRSAEYAFNGLIS